MTNRSHILPTSAGSVMLSAHGVECRRGNRSIVSGVDLTIPAGSRLALVGPNGAGKSTLLKAMAGMETPAQGQVTVDGADLHSMRGRHRAQTVAVMGQEEAPSAELTLAEAVSLGRVPHRSPWALAESGERAMIEASLAAVGLAGREEDYCTQLSGGERHRVVLARTLAQHTPVLVLDEPTNHLDAAWRLRLMEILDTLECTVLAAMHDLDLVLRHFDAVAVVAEGRLYAYGDPVSTLSPELLQDVFGVRGEVITHPSTGRPHLLLSEAVLEGSTPTSSVPAGSLPTVSPHYSPLPQR